MDKKTLNELWSIRGDHWEDVDEGWEDCQRCYTQPRIWRFNNGSFAKCICYGVYDSGPIRTESILSYVKRNDGSAMGYPRDSLRTQWNKFAHDGVERKLLPDGQW